MSRREDFTDMALGLVSAQSFPAIVGIADHMLKSSGVTLVGYEKIGGGHCTAIVRGNVADVRLAVQEGAERAEQFGQKLSTLVVPRPMPNLEVVLPIGNRLAQLATGRGHSKLSNQAVGLLETRGFPAMVGAADAMLKAADVVLAAYETIGAGLCTAIVRGSVANVAMALDVGMVEAERIGELHAVMLVPRPLDDLDQTLPLASCWIEEMQPLKIPLAVKETQKETIALPELTQEMKELTVPNGDRALPEPAQIEAKPPEMEPQRLEQSLTESLSVETEGDSSIASSDAAMATPPPKRTQHHPRRRDRRH
ncbi:carbon dioxide concentrating mechanism/carboxysome shell protein [Leptolyngbyaceae cyanobacterium JSC-12]|nr:carbon dioxide concentrating mechanism/carboxysome shell protein [Leptolyngbyaceae cyanobacterium JSC-12]